MLSGVELIIAALIVFAGATVMGTLGFGFGLVVAPVFLLLLEPQETVVTVNGIITVLLILIMAQSYRHLRLLRLWPMAAGGLAAAPIGVLALSGADPTTLRITIALVIMALAVLNLTSIQLPMVQNRLVGAVVGFLTSLAITTLSIGGPLAALYVVARRWPHQEIRASLAFFFIVSYLAAFGLYARSGLVHQETMANIGMMVPSVVAGFGLATLLVRRINQRIFRYAVTGVIIGGSAALLGQEFVG